MNHSKFVLSSITGMLVSTTNLLAIPLCLLLVVNILDWITGLMAAKYRAQTITSEMSYKGIARKVSMYFLIAAAFIIDVLIFFVSNQFNVELIFPNVIACVVTMWLIVNELLSITENCIDCGIDVPILRPLIKILKGKFEGGNKNE